MENSAILTADILDIIFDGRNKAYGAYELRRTYNKRLRISLLVMLAVILLLFIAQLVAGKSGSSFRPDEKPEINLIDVTPPPEEVTPPVPPPSLPPPPAPPPTKMTQFTPPIITDDDQVKDDEKPPLIDDLDNARIGTVNVDGADDNNLVAPPVTTAVGKGIIEPPKRPARDSIFEKVEIDASYPGGPEKWKYFLQRNLSRNLPQVAIDNNIQGTVEIKFVVDEQGNVSNVKAISGPEELHACAIAVIKKSGKWIPAIQNGQQVKAYKLQPITIRFESD